MLCVEITCSFLHYSFKTILKSADLFTGTTLSLALKFAALKYISAFDGINTPPALRKF